MDRALISKLIVDVPDYPKPGILFKDITPILKDPLAFTSAINAMRPTDKIDAIIGIEARGFIFAAALALNMQLPFVPVRKPGKLPRPTYSITYQLEYGTDSLHIHQDALNPGARYLIVDDVLATGGTAIAAADLLTTHGGIVTGFSFCLELETLAGATKIASRFPSATITSLITV